MPIACSSCSFATNRNRARCAVSCADMMVRFGRTIVWKSSLPPTLTTQPLTTTSSSIALPSCGTNFGGTAKMTQVGTVTPKLLSAWKAIVGSLKSPSLSLPSTARRSSATYGGLTSPANATPLSLPNCQHGDRASKVSTSQSDLERCDWRASPPCPSCEATPSKPLNSKPQKCGRGWSDGGCNFPKSLKRKWAGKCWV